MNIKILNEKINKNVNSDGEISLSHLLAQSEICLFFSRRSELCPDTVWEAAGWPTHLHPLNTAQPKDLKLSVFRPRAMCDTGRGYHTSCGGRARPRSLTGKLDHISANAALQHLHHGEPDTHTHTHHITEIVSALLPRPLRPQVQLSVCWMCTFSHVEVRVPHITGSKRK